MFQEETDKVPKANKKSAPKNIFVPLQQQSIGKFPVAI